MLCAWQSFINLLPIRMREKVDKLGSKSLLELRLRINAPPELVTMHGTELLTLKTTADDLFFVINTATKYSPWSSTTTANGYITAPGGHRIGLCGNVIQSQNSMRGFHTVTSICIRIARDFPGIARDADKLQGSVLIIGRPASGKTTLLRDIIRNMSDKSSMNISVVDEREEIFPRTGEGFCFSVGSHTDIISGCKKGEGIETVLRCMSPEMIAVDEITAKEDCDALLYAGWCGVRLLATAHAGNREELFRRPV